ncbi:uncharacterized protein LOC116351778 isoform X2 [Contarinia nasturtii]|uniref:uncharacterized protein LOC116351778 isoform X2 n=1 Tax=Contarinia nasturtii TaxID=265458 RepID=UPI0012D389E3|nr:uncharacterized protein LOC116351778 isoform X2 [Contarinia nasturtii]
MQKVTFVRILNILLVFGLVSIILMFIYHNFIKPHVNCKPTITTAIGYAASKICSGALIFEENFDKLDKHKWRPQVTLSTHGANGDFQLYVAGDKNSFATDGHLNIKPTLTAQKIGYDKVENGSIHLNDCTDANKSNCERKTDGNSIINPIRSARLHTKSSFAFKYGRVELFGFCHYNGNMVKGADLVKLTWCNHAAMLIISIQMAIKSVSNVLPQHYILVQNQIWTVGQVQRIPGKIQMVLIMFFIDMSVFGMIKVLNFSSTTLKLDTLQLATVVFGKLDNFMAITFGRMVQKWRRLMKR